MIVTVELLGQVGKGSTWQQAAVQAITALRSDGATLDAIADAGPWPNRQAVHAFIQRHDA